MKDRCIVSCCFSESNGAYYAKYADRLEQSLDQYCPGVDRTVWRHSWPPGSISHRVHNYAFKWFAVNEAIRQGYRYVMWLDAGCCAVAPIDPLWKHVEENGSAILLGADILGTWISDKVLEYFKVDREKSMGMRLAGGCLVGLDMENRTSRRFFDWWGELAKTTNFFAGSNNRAAKIDGVMRSVQTSDADGSINSLDPRVKGHRSDEACFSLMMDKLGMEGFTLGDWHAIMKTY